MCNKYRYKQKEVYKANDILDFGKYKGKTIAEVLQNHPHYIEWALNNIEGFEISEELKRYLLEEYYPDEDYSWHPGYGSFMYGEKD